MERSARIQYGAGFAASLLQLRFLTDVRLGCFLPEFLVFLPLTFGMDFDLIYRHSLFQIPVLQPKTEPLQKSFRRISLCLTNKIYLFQIGKYKFSILSVSRSRLSAFALLHTSTTILHSPAVRRQKTIQHNLCSSKFICQFPAIF